jgi:hypothetical protein
VHPSSNVDLNRELHDPRSLDRLEIVPNVAASLIVRFGSPRFVVLNTLKMSHRSVASARGPTLIPF